MSQDWFADVVKFMRAMNQEVGDTPAKPSQSIRSLRNDLIFEEFHELIDAIGFGDLPVIAKEAIDQIYVNLGLLAAYGIDPRPVWDAVHGDNMRKVDGPIREDGKRLKPEGWKATDIGPILAKQRSLNNRPEDIADEWIKRNGRNPQFDGEDWQWYQCDFNDESDHIPYAIFNRLLNPDKSHRLVNYNTVGQATADLRQALVSMIQDGIELPEIPVEKED